MDFDTGRFIFEIEKRPAIWNTKVKDYSDRILKIKMWEEIVVLFGGKEMSSDEKKNLGLSLQKKWKNLRDSFVKEYRKVRTCKSGSSATRKPTYLYFNRLLFLKDIVFHKRDYSLSSATGQQDTEIETIAAPYETPKFMYPKQKTTKAEDTESENIGADLVGVLKESLCRNDDDPDRHFLLSLLNDFGRIPEHLKGIAKINVMKVIMDASQPYPPPQYSGHLSASYRNPYGSVTNIGSPESQNSDHYQNDAASKKEPHPLEPRVVIKEEPVEFGLTPTTSSGLDCLKKEEFILPNEENAWTSADSRSSSGMDSASLATFSGACLGTDQDKTSSTSPVLGDPPKRKRKASPLKLSVSTPAQKVVRTSLDSGIVPTDCLQPQLGNADDSSNTNFLNGFNARNRPYDQFDAFAEYTAVKLRSLDKRSCAFAQKAIWDIIFDAKMGKFIEGVK